MKKPVLVLLSLIIICSCTFSLSACSSSDKGYVLPSDVQVDTISVYLPESRTDYTVSGEELSQLVECLRAQPKLEKDEVVFNVGKESVSRSAIYSVKITTKKKFMQKAKTYTVMVGSNTKRTDMYGKESKSSDSDDLRITGFNGTATSALVALVAKIVNREDLKYVEAHYDKLRAKFVEEGYTVTEMEFETDFVSNGHSFLKQGNDIKGFSANKSTPDETLDTGVRNDWINVVLCKTAAIAYGYTENGQHGGSILRIYYGGSAAAYEVIRSVPTA